MEFLFQWVVEVTSEVIWAWSYLYGNVSNQKLYFNNYAAIQVIYFFFLILSWGIQVFKFFYIF